MSNGNKDRDIECAADVGRMARLGKFDGEFHVYGSAVRGEDGVVCYWATADEKKLRAHIAGQLLEGRYYTPVAELSRRCKVPAGMEEQLLQECKYALLRQVKQDYERSGYLEQMAPFFAEPANNNGYALLAAHAEKIDGHFDDTELQNFFGAMQIAYEAKLLTAEGYRALQSWHDKVRRQMADDPVVEDQLGRTFYGFVYEKPNGGRGFVFDAQEMTTVRRREALQLQGCLTGAVLRKTYWFQQFSQLNSIRQAYQKWLLAAQDDAYFQLLRALRSQRGVIDAAALQAVKSHLSENKNARAAVDYYAVRWNSK